MTRNAPGGGLVGGDEPSFGGASYGDYDLSSRVPLFDIADSLSPFPRTIENGLYLVVLILWVAHALYRALRDTSHAPALFGSVLGIVGLGLLAAGALPHVATAPISDLYHALGATPEVQTTLVLVWQATQGIFDALLIVGLVVLPIGLIALGVAMLGTPAFGKRFGGVSVGLGVIGVVAATVALIDPLSPMAAVGVFALIIFDLVLGWKVYSLSRASWELSRKQETAS